MPRKTIFNSTVDEVSASAKDQVGDIREENGKVYKYILFDSGTADAAGSAGDAVAYHDGDAQANGAGDGYADNRVTTDYSDSVGTQGAGILVADMTDGQYGWIQIKGLDTLSTALEGSAADGDPVTVKGASDKAMTRADEGDSAGAMVPVYGRAVDANEKTVLLDFPM